MKGFKSSFCNTVFFMILIFAALQVFLNSFLIKWGKKWKRLWNSSKKNLDSIYSIWNDFFCYFSKWWFSQRCLKLDVEMDNVVTTLSYVVYINVETHKHWFEVAWRCKFQRWNTTLFQRWFEVFLRRDVISTKRQCYNVQTTLKC